jgi:hypothetical protein
MRLLKTASFAKDAKANGLSDDALSKALKEVLEGLVDAGLGANLYKKRIRLANRGKSGGLRTIFVYKASAVNLFCIYVFAKSETENISQRQLLQLKAIGQALLILKEKEIEKAIEIGALQEVL